MQEIVYKLCNSIQLSYDLMNLSLKTRCKRAKETNAFDRDALEAKGTKTFRLSGAVLTVSSFR
jgi:hypothetical protein